MQNVEHVPTSAPRWNHRIDTVTIEQRPDAIAVTGQETRQQGDEFGGQRPLLHMRAVYRGRAEVQQKPRRNFSVFVVNPDMGRLQTRGDVPVDVTDIVVILVFAQISQIEPDTTKQGLVIAVKHSVQATNHGPLQSPQYVLSPLPLAYGVWLMAYGYWFHLYAISYMRSCLRAGCDFDMGLQRLIGSRYMLHDPMDQLICRHRLGEGLIGQHQPMPKYIGHQIPHVLRQNVGASAQESQRPRALDEIDRSARARAEGYVLTQAGDTVAIGIPRSGGEPHRVLLERRVHIDVPALALKHAQLFGGRHRDDIVGTARYPVDDTEVFSFGWVPDEHLHHESVDLCLGQRVGALRLNGILGGHYQERLGDPVTLAGDCDLSFLHHLEQRALHFRRSPVDLIGKKEVGEDGTQRGGKVAGLLVVDACSHQ